MTAKGPGRTERPGIAIFGPTSSGKTLLSISVALELQELGFRPVALNADSRQVYTGMDVGTSKVRPEEAKGVEHRLIDIADPVRKLPLESYIDRARQEFRSLYADANAVPLLVGGTGTYVKGLVEGWELSGSAAARRAIERDFPPAAVADAYELLSRLAPRDAQAVHRRDYTGILNRLARHLHESRNEPNVSPPFHFVTFGVARPMRETNARIAQTLDSQLEQGLLAEIGELEQRYDLVRQYRRHGQRSRHMALQTHGYREFFEYAANRSRPVTAVSEAELRDIKSVILTHIWDYARRQRSWFRKLPNRPTAPNAEGVRTIVASVAKRRT